MRKAEIKQGMLCVLDMNQTEIKSVVVLIVGKGDKPNTFKCLALDKRDNGVIFTVSRKYLFPISDDDKDTVISGKNTNCRVVTRPNNNHMFIDSCDVIMLNRVLSALIGSNDESIKFTIPLLTILSTKLNHIVDYNNNIDTIEKIDYMKFDSEISKYDKLNIDSVNSFYQKKKNTFINNETDKTDRFDLIIDVIPINAVPCEDIENQDIDINNYEESYTSYYNKKFISDQLTLFMKDISKNINNSNISYSEFVDLLESDKLDYNILYNVDFLVKEDSMFTLDQFKVSLDRLIETKYKDKERKGVILFVNPHEKNTAIVTTDCFLENGDIGLKQLREGYEWEEVLYEYDSDEEGLWIINYDCRVSEGNRAPYVLILSIKEKGDK